jgi:hypothetical protein
MIFKNHKGKKKFFCFFKTLIFHARAHFKQAKRVPPAVHVCLSFVPWPGVQYVVDFPRWPIKME